MKGLSYLFRGAWRRLSCAVMLAILGGLCSAALLTVIGEGISGISRGAELAWMFGGLCVATLVFRSSATVTLIHITQAIGLRLRMELSSKLLATPLAHQQQIGRSELQTILTADIMAVTQALHALPLILSDLVLVTACLTYLAWLSTELFGMLVLALLVALACYLLAQRMPVRHTEALRQQLDEVNRHVFNMIAGSKELQLNARRREFFLGQLAWPAAQRFRQLFVASMSGYTLVTNFGTLMFFMIVGGMLMVRPMLAAPDEAALGQYVLTLLYLLGPISSMMSAVPGMRQGAIALRRIEQLSGRLAPPAAVPDAHATFDDGQGWHLALHGVSHEYQDRDGRTFKLGPLDFEVRQGEVVFIVGGNGSGKTTLAMLLLGFYAPKEGSIVLNGRAVDEHSREAYRQHFAAVFSDFHLFEHVLDNDAEALSERANSYLGKLGMGHKVRVEQGRFSTTDLSTGQRKRLALVSAYLEDRPVYLFDEWAADQDPEFKRVFYTELLPELKQRGKIVLAITHDDAYFHCADRIVKLDEGRLRDLTAI